MKPEIALCADMESIKNPKLLGLEGENLLAQPWMRLFCSALEARKYLAANDDVKEVWVASSDDIDPINLAAALKKDAADRAIYLLSEKCTGSLSSRAHAASLNGVFAQADLARKYGERKAKHARPLQVPGSEQGQARETGRLAPTACTRHAGASENGTGARDAASIESNASARPHARQRIAAPFADSKRRAVVIPIVSASGGTGKSTVAVTAACLSQRLGRRTLLLDADLQFGDARFLMGVEDPVTVEDVIADPSRITHLRTNGVLPALLAAPPHLEKAEEIIPHLGQAIERASEAFDVVIVNTGAFWTEEHAALLERATHALFLVDQRPSSLRACRHALELCARCGIATSPFIFAVNRCTKHALFTSIDVSCALGGVKSVEFDEGGKAVEDLLAAGLPLELVGGKNSFCASIENFLNGILPQRLSSQSHTEPAMPEGKRFLFPRRKRKAACL